MSVTMLHKNASSLRRTIGIWENTINLFEAATALNYYGDSDFQSFGRDSQSFRWESTTGWGAIRLVLENVPFRDSVDLLSMKGRIMSVVVWQ